MPANTIKLLAAFFILLLSAAGQTHAQDKDMCAAITRMLKEADTKFAGVKGEKIGLSEAFSTYKCTVSFQQAADATLCETPEGSYVVYTMKSEKLEAKDFDGGKKEYEAIVSQLEHCPALGMVQIQPDAAWHGFLHYYYPQQGGNDKTHHGVDTKLDVDARGNYVMKLTVWENYSYDNQDLCASLMRMLNKSADQFSALQAKSLGGMTSYKMFESKSWLPGATSTTIVITSDTSYVLNMMCRTVEIADLKEIYKHYHDLLTDCKGLELQSVQSSPLETDLDGYTYFVKNDANKGKRYVRLLVKDMSNLNLGYWICIHAGTVN